MAKFKVIKIDPNGSGIDWSGHLGMVFDGVRCCKNCTVIFGPHDLGPFILGELESADDAAQEIMDEILAFKLERSKRPPVQVIKTRAFQKAIAEICGEVYFDAPTFEIKKGSA